VTSGLIVDRGGSTEPVWTFLERRETIANANVSTPDRHCTDYVARVLVDNGVMTRIFEHKKKYN
jgi:hypothetical protein